MCKFQKILIFLSLLVFTSFLNAQITVTGKITDNTNQPIEFANVVLVNKENNNIVTGTITDTKGNFTIKTAKGGNFNLQISFVGFKDYMKIISTSVNLETIRLKSDNELNEIIITARKKLIERKVDRLVFNVENSISAIGGDAIGLLKITPRIRVNNDNISMIGKNNMSVMIDDKIISLSGDDLINLLRSISSDNIKSIEVITTPPAKYDAEGNSGLINIKLKKSKLNQWNASIKSAYTQSTYAKGTYGSSFDYQKNNFSIYTNLNYTKGSSAPIETNKIYYPSGLSLESNKGRYYQNSFHGRIGIDYSLTKKWSIGLQYIGSISQPKSNENSKTSIFNADNTQISSSTNTISSNLNKNNSNSLNLNSTIKLDTTGGKMIVNLDYFKFKNDNNRVFNTINLLSANNIGSQNIENYSGKIDFEHPIKWFNLGYGAKVSFIKTKSNVAYFDTTTGMPIFDSTLSNEFNYDENTQSVYINGSKKLSEKWETQLGFRLESTQTKGLSKTLNQKNTNSYTKIFPTFYLTYTPSDKNSFSLTYNKRINRPFYDKLNPFRWYSNSFSYVEGNPFLQPSFSNNIEFNYIYNNNWSNSIYYSYTNDGFEQITIVDNTSNIQKTIAQNYFNTSLFGISESYTFNKSQWLSSTVSFNWFYSKSKSFIPITNQILKGANAYFSTSNDINVNKNLKFNISYWFNFKGTSDLDKNNAFSQLDMSIKYFMFNKKLQLGFKANDIFKSNKPIYTSFTNNIQIDYINYYDVRLFRLSLVYKFGNKNIKIKRKEFGNKEEKERIN